MKMIPLLLALGASCFGANTAVGPISSVSILSGCGPNSGTTAIVVTLPIIAEGASSSFLLYSTSSLYTQFNSWVNQALWSGKKVSIQYNGATGGTVKSLAPYSSLNDGICSKTQYMIVEGISLFP